ncbi:MAG: gamma-glutamyltransferase [Hyphomicrobiales bacterium]
MTEGKGIGVVAAGHRVTAGTAAEILRAGGNAADAAIAAIAMSFVAEPVLAAPGGGGFAMVRDGASGKVSVYDFFTQTPRQKRAGNDGEREIHADFGTATQSFHIGPATAATPGIFAGLAAMHEHAASMDLSDLMAPAAHTARAGVTITPFQHYLSTVVAPILTATQQTRALFAPDGEMIPVGKPFHNPGLAQAIETIGKGRSGLIQEAIVELQDGRGHLTEDDFSSYKVEERTPLEVAYEGARIYLNPTPAASGPMIAHSLEAMDGKIAEGMAAALNSADENRQELTGAAAFRGTTHVSVIDRHGNACSVTVSNGEGNGELVPGFGFMVNNMLGEEDVNPHRAGEWPLNTRMSSMMCPSLVEHEDGSITVLGSGGSNRIRSAIFHVLVRMIRKGFPLEKAIRAPRMHIERGHLDVEGFFKVPALEALKRNFPDHRIWPEQNMFFGGVHGARMRIDDTFSGHGDARRDGIALVVD